LLLALLFPALLAFLAGLLLLLALLIVALLTFLARLLTFLLPFLLALFALLLVLLATLFAATTSPLSTSEAARAYQCRRHCSGHRHPFPIFAVHQRLPFTLSRGESRTTSVFASVIPLRKGREVPQIRPFGGTI